MVGLYVLYIYSPHGTVKMNFQYRFSANVWCGVTDGPFLLEGWLTGAISATFFEHELLLEDVPLITRTQMYFPWRMIRQYSQITHKPDPSKFLPTRN
jgi:hypothetical protein